jgi:uncharacterized protein (DUF4415 family)
MESEPKAAFLKHNETLTNFAGTKMEPETTAELEPRLRLPGHRGRQKRPTKVLVTMRFSPEILTFFKANGDGWQTRINDVLREYVEQNSADKT